MATQIVQCGDLNHCKSIPLKSIVCLLFAEKDHDSDMRISFVGGPHWVTSRRICMRKIELSIVVLFIASELLSMCVCVECNLFVCSILRE